MSSDALKYRSRLSKDSRTKLIENSPPKRVGDITKKLIAALAIASSFLLTGCTSTTSSESTSVISTPEVELIGNEAPVSKVAPETVSQQNAHSKAASYLEFSAFSRSGLIEQLEFEGFSTQDSTWAVDNVTVNWNEQAAMKAASYLDYSAFSRSGLMDQLGYEGFTRAQANYAVSQLGL